MFPVFKRSLQVCQQESTKQRYRYFLTIHNFPPKNRTNFLKLFSIFMSTTYTCSQHQCIVGFMKLQHKSTKTAVAWYLLYKRATVLHEQVKYNFDGEWSTTSMTNEVLLHFYGMYNSWSSHSSSADGRDVSVTRGLYDDLANTWSASSWASTHCGDFRRTALLHSNGCPSRPPTHN